MTYDRLYQDWLRSRRSGDYQKADRLRTIFEYLHGLTIFTEGAMVVENLTVRRMKAATWQRKYGDRKLALAYQDNDSLYKSPLLDCGHHYEV